MYRNIKLIIIDAIESQIYLDNKVFNLKASIGLSESTPWDDTQ